MALPVIIAALLGKAAAGAATKAVAGKVAASAASKSLAGKAATAGAKAAGSHHAHGAAGREIIGKVKEEVVSQVKDKAEEKAEEKAKGWWSRGRKSDPDQA